MKVLSLLLFLVICFIAAPTLAQKNLSDREFATTKALVQTEFQKLYDDSNFPGGSLAIVLPDGRVITAVAGFASVEDEARIKPDDRLMSASIGKTYFAAMALDLIHGGKLDLDDKVSEYLGQKDWFDRIPNSDELTIAHLMRHQSGLPRYVLDRQVWQDVMANPNMSWNHGDQLTYIYDRQPLHPAGKGWAYSDTNYILLGLILEKVSARPAYDYVRKRFLEPNALNDTLPNDRRSLPGLVQGYSTLFKAFGVPEKVVDNGQFVFNPQMEWCGGGFLCTPTDLAKWAHLYFSGNALQGNYVDTMTANAADSSRMLGANSKYGLGVIIRETRLGKLLGHDGGFPGYSSTMGYYPEHNLAAAFMYNCDTRGALGKRASDVMTDMVELVASEMKR